MAVKERRQREKDDLRRKILAAAQQIITSEGFAALSMRKLADHIEYSAASIYLHFRNREQIARELGDAGYGQLLAMMTAAAEEEDVLKRLKAVGMSYVAFGLEHPETYRLIFMGDSEYMAAAFAEHAPGSAASRSYQLLVDLAVDLKKARLYAGKAAPGELAEMLWAAMHGIVSLKLACTGFLTSAENLADLMTGTLISGLIAKPRVSNRSPTSPLLTKKPKNRRP